MKGEFINGKYYYLKLSISEIRNYKFAFFFISPGTLKYRLDGGSWVSGSGTPLFLYHLDNNPVSPIYLFKPTSINVSSNTTIELYGQFESFKEDNNPMPVDSDIYRYFQKCSIAEPIEMELYKLKCEPHLVTKSVGTDILLVGNVYGALREEIDLTSPFVTFEYDSVPDFNYVYIPSLSRYYFVNNITSIRTHVYRLDLHVDVLKTYDTDIRKQNAFISRCENSYNRFIVDDRLPLAVNYTTYAPTITNGTLKNITFSTFNIDNNIVIVANSEKFADSYDLSYDAFTRPNSLVDVVDPFRFTEKKIYAMVPSSASTLYEQSLVGFFKASFNKSSIGDSILNVIAFPFDVMSVSTYDSGYLSVANSYINYDGSTLSGNLPPKDVTPWVPDNTIRASRLHNTISKFLVLSDFTFPYPKIENASIENTPYQWLAYEPYSNYEMFIPYYGWVKLNSKDILGKRLIVYYSVNYITGAANVFIETISDNKIIFSATCQLGTLLSVSVSNKMELNNQKNANALNLILGLISSGISVGVGAINGNPVAVSGGVITGSKTIAETINKSSVLFERTQATFHDSNSGIYGIQDIMVRIYTRQPKQYIDSYYKHVHGLPLDATEDLTSITGYTEIPEMHYVPDTQLYITKSEIDEIISLAKDGIIL